MKFMFATATAVALGFSPALVPAVAAAPVAETFQTASTFQEDCGEEPRGSRRNSQSRGGGGLGGLVGSIAGDWVDDQLRGTGASYETRRRARGFVASAISCMLSPVEQAEAEAATTRALDGAVGTTEEWTSSERTGVSGRSTVTGERVSRGTTCRSVSSVAIADGEEVTIAQNYCRGSDGRWVKQDA